MVFPRDIHETAAKAVLMASMVKITMRRAIDRYTTASFTGCGARGNRQQSMTATTNKTANKNLHGLEGRSYCHA